MATHQSSARQRTTTIGARSGGRMPGRQGDRRESGRFDDQSDHPARERRSHGVWLWDRGSLSEA